MNAPQANATQTDSHPAGNAAPHVLPAAGMPLYGKLLWLTAARLGIATILLALATRFIFQTLTDSLSLVEHTLFIVILVSYAVSLGYLLVLRKSRQVSPTFAVIQVMGDALFANLVVYLTGSTESIFVFLLPLCVISAANIFSRKGAFLAAGAASLLFAGLTLSLAFHWLPTPILSPTTPPFRRMVGMMLMDILAIVLTGLLGGLLSEQLRRASAALKSREAAYLKLEKVHECIVRSVPSGLITMDMDCRIHSSNPAAERILGISGADLRGRDARQLLPALTSGLKPEGMEEAEAKLSQADGRTRWISVSAAPLRELRSSEGAGFVVTFSDTTERHQLAEAIHRSERMAAIGQLSAGLAHELRNPLASMSGSIQLLAESPTLDPDDRRLMDIVLRETDRLDALVGDFLRYARPRPLQPVPFDLAETIRASAALLQKSLSDKHARLELSLPDSLSVEADQDQIRQVIWNLLINAAAALGENKNKEGLVAVSLKDSGGTVTLAVSDNGCGIPPDTLDKIFTPFFTTKQGGTGLGLAIVHGIVEAHGGTISVQSTPGQGTAFTVVLPSKNGRV